MAASAKEPSALNALDRSLPVELRREYPIARRFVLMRVAPWLIIFIAIWIGLQTFDTIFGSYGSGPAEEVWQMLCASVLLTVAVLVGIRLIYELVYFKLYRYGLELEHLVIAKGVLWRTRASFPLTKITDIYVEQTPLELLFGLATLQVTTPAAVTNFGGIEGLSTARSVQLQQYLLALINTTQPTVDEAAAEESVQELEIETSAREADQRNGTAPDGKREIPRSRGLPPLHLPHG